MLQEGSRNNKMFTRKFIMLMLTIAIIFAARSSSYAASGEGYFGDEEIEFDAAPEPKIVVASAPTQSKPDNSVQKYRPSVFTYSEAYEEEASPIDEEDEEISSKASVASSLEKRSENTEKVLRSYDVDEATFNRMLDRHKDAEKRVGNREKVDRYEILFNEYPYDYLAAYRAAQANMAMGRHGQARTWLERALKINPNYLPAKQLMKKVQAR